MKKITAFFTVSLLVFSMSIVPYQNTTYAYSSDVHEYLTEEALKFLKTKNPEAYDEMKTYLYDLRKGAYDEDAIGPDLNEKIDTYWRPFRHFYRITDGLGYLDGGERSISSLFSDPNTSSDFSNTSTDIFHIDVNLSDYVLADAPDNRRYPNAYEWASGNEILNKHDFQDAVDAYKAGNKKEAYYTLGFVLHLIEDMSVPEHTQLESHNDDPFPTGGLEEGSGYEQFIADQYSGVSENNCSSNKLRNYLHPFCTPPGVEDPFHAQSVDPVFSYYDDVLSGYTNLKQYFDSMATLGYYRNRFKATLNPTTGKATDELANMFEISHVSGNTWMIFSDVGLWSGGDTVKTTDTWWETTKFDGNPDASGWYYIENSYNKLDLQGKTKPKVYKKDWYNYAETEMKKTPTQRFITANTGQYVQNTEGKVLADIMAEDLIPLSVQHAAGIMDLFWRETRSLEPKIQIEVGGYLLPAQSYTDFGNVTVGTDKTITFTVRNIGAGVLTVGSKPSLEGGTYDQNHFEIVKGTSDQSLTAGETTTFQIKFKPTSVGYKSLGYSLYSSDRSFIFHVKGTGVEGVVDEVIPSVESPVTSGEFTGSGDISCMNISNPITYNTFEINHYNEDFELTLLGYNKSRSFLIKNTGSEELTIIPHEQSNYNYLTFENYHIAEVVNNNFKSVLLPNECVALTIIFRPTTVGWQRLSFNISNSHESEIVSFSGDAIDSIDDYYIYGVAPNDFLGGIGQKFGTASSIIIEDNNIDNVYLIQRGDLLKIRKNPDIKFDLGVSTTFTDTINHWAETYINALYEKGIIKGRTDTTFEPDATINRAELVKMAIISKGLDIPSSISTSSFADVPVSSWFAPYVEKAYTEGIVEGNVVNGKRYFRPNDPVIRAEALKILLYSANHKTFNDSDTTKLFSDVNSGDWFYDLVAYAKNNNIVSGYPDGSFKPGNAVTRAEAAKILHSLFFENPTLSIEEDNINDTSTLEPISASSSTIHSTSTGGDWDNPETWIEKRVPNNSDIVEVSSHVIHNQQPTTTIKSLIISTDGVIEKNSGDYGNIQVEGDMINNGIIKNNISPGSTVQKFYISVTGDLTNIGTIEVTCLKVEGQYTNNNTIIEDPYCWPSI